MKNVIAKSAAIALIGLACASAPAQAGGFWNDHGGRGHAYGQDRDGHGARRVANRLRSIAKPLKQILRNGERPSVDIQATVQIGGGGPVVVEQNSDVNIAHVIQFGSNSPVVVDQTGTVNIGRVTQRNHR